MEETENEDEEFEWFTRVMDFLRAHDLLHIEIGNKQHEKTTREIEGDGVQMKM